MKTITPVGYLVTYYYVSPSGTYSENEKPTFSVKSGYFKTLDAAIDFIGEDFDGQDMYKERCTPEIRDHFRDSDKEYILDDWGAGQWATIMPHFGEDVSFNF